MTTLIREVKYIKADVRQNNNKFWYGKVYDDATVHLNWGRVGAKGQTKVKEFYGQYEAEDFLSKKETEKSRKGYKPLNVIGEGETVEVTTSTSTLATIAKDQIRTDSSLITKLIDYFTQANIHNITTATGGQITFNGSVFQTPLGIVTQDAIDRASNVLSGIGSLVANQDYGYSMEDKTNEYLMLVPQNIGMRKLDVRSFFGSLADVQKQQSIVDSLQASLDSLKTAQDASQDDAKVFDVDITLVKDDSVLDRIKRLYKRTRQTIHSCNGLRVKKVYEIDIASVREAFEQGKSVGNVKELWHGTRVCNILSILQKGLIIPPANSSHCTGRMFGNGLYFSDQSTKALNYSYGYWGGGSSDTNCFMFLADVAMGKAYSPSNRYSKSFPVAGYDSTNVKGGNAGVYNNEMIVYKTNQVNLKYLVEFSK